MIKWNILLFQGNIWEFTSDSAQESQSCRYYEYTNIATNTET